MSDHAAHTPSGTGGYMPPESGHDVRLYGARDCHKSRFYEDALKERNVDYLFRDVEANKEAARELSAIFGSDPAGHTKYPTFLIKGKRLRNPRLRDLNRALAHEGLYDPGIVHETPAQRFTKFMSPQDAFVSYSQTDDRITLGHIEVPVEKRGSGLGAKLALAVFPLVQELGEMRGKSARITCPFMRKVAASVPEWAEYFNVNEHKSRM
jgi:glutaredoxin/predicted GNAT family acetyltransferase